MIGRLALRACRSSAQGDECSQRRCADALHGSAARHQGWRRSYLVDLLFHDAEQLEENAGRHCNRQRLRRFLEAYALLHTGPHVNRLAEWIIAAR